MIKPPQPPVKPTELLQSRQDGMWLPGGYGGSVAGRMTSSHHEELSRQLLEKGLLKVEQAGVEVNDCKIPNPE